MIKIRNAKKNDLDEIVMLEDRIWAEGIRADKRKFESRLKIFPEGFFLAFNNDKLIGFSTSEIINYDSNPLSWEDITDNGYIKNHNKNGNTLYVVSIGAISRSGGGSALINAQKDLVKKLNLRNLVLGSRIPGYDEYSKKKGEINIKDYATSIRENGELLDPELRFYTRNGLTLLEIVPNYMEDDKESRNYGAIMILKYLEVYHE